MLRGGLLSEAMFDQPRHVVYHSHYSRIFNSHWPDHAESTETSILSHLIRRRNQRAATHRARRMLATDYNVYVSRVRVSVVNTFVEYLNQARLLFKHAKQLSHP